MGEFRMPSLGADMEAGTLVEWHVSPGSHVKRGDIVALVETQKGIVEIEIWETGVVSELLVQPGTNVSVGTVLATLREDGKAAAVSLPPAPPVAASREASSTKADGPTRAAAPSVRERSVIEHVRASPAARQRARERGVDLSTISGTGPHGVVTRDDVERVPVGDERGAPAATPPVAPAQEKSPPTPPSPRDASANMRKAIAAAMARSKREIPHYYLTSQLDVSRAASWLEQENAERPVADRIVFAVMLLKATALALQREPELNGFFIEGAFRPSEAVHIGVAIALRQGGLVAPAIHDTDRRSLDEIMRLLQDLVARARRGSLRSSEMSDPTITVTNLGDQGTDEVLGVIYPPQVALVGFGTMRERPWAESGMLAVRPVVVASLAADHRVSDGHRGARFLATIGHLLNEPEKL